MIFFSESITYKKHKFKAAFVMKQMDKLKCRIMKETTFIVAKIKMSISTSQKGQDKPTCIPG